MKRLAIIWLASLGPWAGGFAHAASPSAFDLVGKWEGGIEFGRMKFTMILRVVKTPGNRIAATMEMPEQGVKDMPVAAMLYNHPQVRLEFDQMGGAFMGRLNAAGDEIAGGFEDGPGGKPMEAKFRRTSEVDKPEPVKTYTFTKDEPLDIRGYWSGSFEAFPGMILNMGLKIGRLPDGTFSAHLDIFDQGALDIPATKVSYAKPAARMEWQLFQSSLEAALSEDGRSLSGEWKQRGQGAKLTLKRLAKPATALPEGLSFEPDNRVEEDLRGYWKGTLDAQGQILRLKIRIGRADDSSFAGSMISVDQGAREFPWSTISNKDGKVRLELKLLGAAFSGIINKAGTEIDGNWEQGPNPLPLKLERSTKAEFEKAN